ncbi:ABC transporter permease [Microvirga zambiensis]|uniref:ABC transporter permease n=1 Tax=Microvirga zambiensis TaxID=1402137 RepID=UPI00191D10B3|nr:ABC transporter permease [Microvirga zambiensis]
MSSVETATISAPRARLNLSAIMRLPFIPIFILSVLVICAIFGNQLAPHNPTALNLGMALKPPGWVEGGSWAYPLGTDNLGRDILSRIIAGARISVIVAIYAIIVSGGIGAIFGMMAGYFGRTVDTVIMRIVDIQMSVPALALALVLATLLRPSLSTVLIVIAITYWSWYARIVRAEVISLKQRDYVALARIAGVSTPVIFIRHLLPNIMNTLLVLATLQVGQVIIFEASLSFLGLGIQNPDVSWGLMLADARSYITVAWWAITMPGIAIMLTCLAANLFGDWMRDTFDPKRRQL